MVESLFSPLQRRDTGPALEIRTSGPSNWVGLGTSYPSPDPVVVPTPNDFTLGAVLRGGGRRRDLFRPESVTRGGVGWWTRVLLGVKTLNVRAGGGVRGGRGCGEDTF